MGLTSFSKKESKHCIANVLLLFLLRQQLARHCQNFCTNYIALAARSLKVFWAPSQPVRVARRQLFSGGAAAATPCLD
jgi:hypothetical protein